MEDKIKEAIRTLKREGYVIFDGTVYAKFDCKVSDAKTDLLEALDNIDNAEIRTRILNCTSKISDELYRLMIKRL